MPLPRPLPVTLLQMELKQQEGRGGRGWGAWEESSLRALPTPAPLRGACADEQLRGLGSWSHCPFPRVRQHRTATGRPAAEPGWGPGSTRRLQTPGARDLGLPGVENKRPCSQTPSCAPAGRARREEEREGGV